MVHGRATGTEPTSNESNKNVVTWLAFVLLERYILTRKLDMTNVRHSDRDGYTMDKVVCTRCGSDEVALVRKEMLSSGKYRKKWRCPRCSHTWETTDK